MGMGGGRCVQKGVNSAVYCDDWRAVQAVCHCIGESLWVAYIFPAVTMESSVLSTRRAACSISWWVVKRPKLKRMEASLRSGVRPMARRTCEGSGVPEVQAGGRGTRVMASTKGVKVYVPDFGLSSENAVESGAISYRLCQTRASFGVSGQSRRVSMIINWRACWGAVHCIGW